VWIVSTLLDRADSELARLKDCATLRGHFYDYQSDLMVKSGIFLCLGIGLRDGAIGNWSIVLGFVAAVSVAVASLLADRHLVWFHFADRRRSDNRRAVCGLVDLAPNRPGPGQPHDCPVVGVVGRGSLIRAYLSGRDVMTLHTDSRLSSGCEDRHRCRSCRR
jgi:hypothetical protein